MFPTWVYGVFAAAILLVAYGLGQIVPGLGMIFVVLVSTVGAALAAGYRRRPRRSR